MKEDRHNNIRKWVEEILSEKKPSFVPGKTVIKTGLAEYDHREVCAAIDSLLGGWLGLAKKGREFERKLAQQLTLRCSVLVNSGSSANLLALDAAKTLLDLDGGEIITPALAFPTTVNPILQLGFKPAFVDVDSTLNISPDCILPAINKNTRGILFAHAMGNPAQMDRIVVTASEHNLFIIEDCCSAMGSRFDGAPCGTFGIAATHSFHPAHGMTLGAGGAVSTDNEELSKAVRAMRDWGRECECLSEQPDIQGVCGTRFDSKLGDIDYDHKYMFTQIGYNLKPLELQAAMGLEQLKKLNGFIEARKRNYQLYRRVFSDMDAFFEFPEIHHNADPVFFGFPIIIKSSKIDRRDIVLFLNKKGIATRYFFAGNISKQPAYKNSKFTVSGDLLNTDRAMRNGFWIGIHPGINEEIIAYVADVFKEYISSKRL